MLRDWRVVEQDYVTETLQDGTEGFRSYILIEWDEGKAHKRALDEIKANKEIYDAVKASDMIQEMEDKVDAYCQRYGCD